MSVQVTSPVQKYSPAIKVDSVMSIDPEQLGQEFARWGADDQAAFLRGAALGFDRLGPSAAAMQVHYLAEHLNTHDEATIGNVIELLQGILERITE